MTENLRDIPKILTEWFWGIHQKPSPSDWKSEGYTQKASQSDWKPEGYTKSPCLVSSHTNRVISLRLIEPKWQDPDSKADPWSGWHSTTQCPHPHFLTGSKWLFIFIATDDVPAQATWMCDKTNLHVISYWVITSSRKYNKKLLHYKLSLDTHRVFKNEQTGSALHETKSLKKSVLMDGVIVKFWYNL